MMLQSLRTRHALLLLAATILSSSRICCGERSSNLRTTNSQQQQQQRDLVIGGHDAVRNRYPYYVALQTAENNTECGGTLIAPDVVLTAAHCAKYVQ